MAIELLRILIVSNILGYVLVNGRPEGAPAAACEDGTNIVPGHVPHPPSTRPFPYLVDISSLVNGYDPGENYTITLQGTPANRNFRGFMIQGRVRADDSPAGTFGSANNYQPRCTGDTAATHVNRVNKRNVNLVWTAPPADTGFICFRYAFVDAYETYWSNLTTPCVSQTYILSVSGAVVGDKVTVFYNVSQTSMCTCQLDSEAPVACDPGHMFTDLTPEQHSVNITCTSQSTGLTLSRTLSFMVEVAIGGTANITGDTVIITLDANANGTYQCSLDGGTFQPCVSGSFYSGLSVGQHTVDVQFTPTGSTQVTTFQLQFNIAPVDSGFSVIARATYSGDKITVTYEASAGAVCTCQLDSGAPVPCASGHMFNNVPEGDHTVIVRCSSADGLMTVTSTVSGLQFLSVQLSLESSGTSITVVPQANIGVTYRCRLDDGPFVDCFAGFQFQGVSGGSHTVTVESTSLNGLTSLNTTGTTTVRGSDAILITDIIPSINIAEQNYNFTFNINEKLQDLNITLLVDGSPITVPFTCVRISDEMCYCTFRIANMEYAIGTHTLTFQSILNGEVRGSTSTMFLVTDTALAKFKDIEYSVVEGDGTFRVEIEKVGTTAQTVTLSIQFMEGTAMSRSDYPLFQAAQAVVIPPGPSIDIPVDLMITNDEIVECNETFTLRLVSLDTVRLQIDPARDQANVTIIDDDVTLVGFPGSETIVEGNTGPVEVAYLGTIVQNFMVTVESYRCDGSGAAIPGVDYEPVNVKLTFTPTLRTQIVNIVTIDNDVFEDDERVCLRFTNLTEPCPGSVMLGNDTEVVIADDETPVFTLQCYTNTTGNSIVGRNISVFYFSAAMDTFVPRFQCALNDGSLAPCNDPPPTVYGPLSYGNHTVTVNARSAVSLDEITITHQVLMVQARLRAVNSSAVQISIQSTKDATYRCRLNDGPYFTCNDGDVVGSLSPGMYTLTVEATNITGANPPQHASDVVGPLTLTGGSSGSTCAGFINLTTSDNLSNYQAEWRSRGDRVVFTLVGEGQGWVGIGFSHNRMMAISDIILGAADASNSFVDDRFAFTRDITVQPPRDPIQNVDDTSASFEDGVTTVRFSRQKETGDVNDFSLNDCIFFLFAWGGAVNFSTGQIAYHGFNRRFISDSLMCLPSSSFCPERVDCGQPGTPLNGAVMLFNDTLEDSVAVYSCNFGFKLVGDRNRTCRFSRINDQMWTGTEPICMRITCGNPGEPMNGTVTFNDTFVTSVAEFMCDFGFELIGDSQRICQLDGTWSNMVPECRRITCGDPGRPMNGTVTFNGTYVTSVAQFMCDFGFELIGDTQRICQLNGTWSNMVPECRRINCGDPGSPMNGMVATNGTYVTSIAEFMCDDGYMLVGDTQRICQLDGTWSNMVPECPPVDCGSPGTPTNGNAIIISTTFGTTIMYSCSSTYILCGSDSRTCQANATWSGEVPECIRSVATVDSTTYAVNENAGSVGIGVSLDRANCQPVNFILTPRVQSPVDASTSDFDNTPINVMIPAGQTMTTVRIPIINDTIVEGPERFDAVLSSNNNDGVTIGNPGQAEVTIIDDGDMMTVMFEMSMYNLTELDGQVEVCLLSNRDNEIPVSVTVQPEETGSAEEPADFTLATSTVTFAPGQLRACYNQSIVNDDVPESTESFIVRIVDNPNIIPGDPQATQINIIDDDGSMIMRNDTVIGDPLYTVPLQISDEMIEANPDVANTSLCYEIHGRSGNTYNLVSDTCVSISADYVQGNTSDINVIGRVGVLAVDSDGNCQRITIDVMECTGTVGSTEVTQDRPYDNAGIRVRKGRRYFRIAVPNCERQDLVSWVICEEGDMLKFVITRGFNLQPTSHGLVGQFWNIPVELEEFTGPIPPNDTLSYYTVSVTPPDGDVRSFVGHLYDVTWDFTPVPCVYAGNRNGGPVAEFNNPNDPVIEGNYTQYQVADIFSTQFTYEQFDESRCN